MAATFSHKAMTFHNVQMSVGHTWLLFGLKNMLPNPALTDYKLTVNKRNLFVSQMVFE